MRPVPPEFVAAGAAGMLRGRGRWENSRLVPWGIMRLVPWVYYAAGAARMRPVPRVYYAAGAAGSKAAGAVRKFSFPCIRSLFLYLLIVLPHF